MLLLDCVFVLIPSYIILLPILIICLFKILYVNVVILIYLILLLLLFLIGIVIKSVIFVKLADDKYTVYYKLILNKIIKLSIINYNVCIVV